LAAARLGRRVSGVSAATARSQRRTGSPPPLRSPSGSSDPPPRTASATWFWPCAAGRRSRLTSRALGRTPKRIAPAAHEALGAAEPPLTAPATCRPWCRASRLGPGWRRGRA